MSGSSLIESGDELELKRIISDIIQKPRLSGIPKVFSETISRAATASGKKTEVIAIKADESIFNHFLCKCLHNIKYVKSFIM